MIVYLPRKMQNEANFAKSIFGHLVLWQLGKHLKTIIFLSYERLLNSSENALTLIDGTSFNSLISFRMDRARLLIQVGVTGFLRARAPIIISTLTTDWQDRGSSYSAWGLLSLFIFWLNWYPVLTYNDYIWSLYIVISNFQQLLLNAIFLKRHY